MTIVYILAAILIFGVLVEVHEFGHFIAAKLCGVRVNEFSIGMGPLLWHKETEETQYSWRLLPIGGYCAMEGEDEDSGDTRSFVRQKTWKKLAILAACPLMNFLTGLLIVLALYVFFYHKIFAITFDETFAQATGVKADLYNTLIAVLTAVTIVLGMRMMGALLISSLIIFPALTSMRVCRTFKSVIINSAVISVVCLVIGITVSYVWATPAGASVVMANIAALLLYSLLGVAKNRGSR